MDIIDEVRQSIANALKIPLAEIAPDTRLEDIGLNSLDVIEVVFALEERFGIDIPLNADDAASKGRRNDPLGNLPFETIAEVAKAVSQHMDAKRAT